ncbi:MAG: hypothetical protein JSV56_07550, partial [Methanomassiliicoccales archaeon]
RGSFQETEIADLTKLGEYKTRSIPYLFYENQEGRLFVYEIPQRLESQYMRRLWARSISMPDQWNWVVFPFEDKMLATIQYFQNQRSPAVQQETSTELP